MAELCSYYERPVVMSTVLAGRACKARVVPKKAVSRLLPFSLPKKCHSSDVVISSIVIASQEVFHCRTFQHIIDLRHMARQSNSPPAMLDSSVVATQTEPYGSGHLS